MKTSAFLTAHAIGFAIAFFADFTVNAAESAAPASRPNVLVILADDLGRGDYSAFGTKDIRTPNIDRLAREGMSFDNFYANSCACSPTRAALMTGCYPDRVGVPGVIRHTPENSWGFLSSRFALLPKTLKSANYHTAIVGKWHLGLASPNTPNERGFDFFHGFLGDMMDDYWTHLRGGQNFMRLNQETIEPTGHATDLFTQWACEYLEERSKSNEPFFLYLAYNAPHDPLQPPQEWLDRVQQREPNMDPIRAKLVGLIEHLDSGIGRVLQRLDELRLSENTLVFFTSDNGGWLPSRANNGPWRSGKTHVYEGGVRVPAFARWPGRIAAGSRTPHAALTMDLYATVCEASGASPPKGIDGVSFLPALLGQPQAQATRDYYYTLREGGPQFGGKSIEAVRRGPWKLLQDRPFSPLELYNLDADPGETNNVIDKNPAVVRDLSAALQARFLRSGEEPWQAPESSGP